MNTSGTTDLHDWLEHILLSRCATKGTSSKTFRTLYPISHKTLLKIKDNGSKGQKMVSFHKTIMIAILSVDIYVQKHSLVYM